MKPHVIRQGEYLSKLAHRFGFDAKKVWDHPKNEQIRALRKNGEVLFSGDIVFIPETRREPMEIKAKSLNKYAAIIPTVEIKLVLCDNTGEPRKNQKFTLYGIGSGGQSKTTDGDGRVTLNVPMSVSTLSLEFEGEEDLCCLHIGHLDPIDEEDGVKQRLEHLGFFTSIPGSLDEQERLASGLRCFQRVNHLEQTGIADQTTKEVLLLQHGS